MKSRSTATELDRLTAAISVQRLAEARGVELVEHDGRLEGRCPFHDEGTAASLVISPAANTWSCSVCSASSGGVIEWVMKAEGVSRTHAVELLRNDKLTGGKGTGRRSSVRKLEPFVPVDSPDDVVMNRVIEFYADALRQDAAASEFLRTRKLDNAELVQHFRLGYSGRSLGYRLPDKNRKAGAALRGQLTRLGVFRSSGHEHFSGSLVVPILDVQGRVVDLYGRKITPGLRAGTSQHLTLADSPRGVFNIAAVADAQEVILCKSILDALSFWTAGHRNVTATYGMNRFTAAHGEAIKNTAKVIVAFERSKAGDAAGDQLADVLGREGKQVFRVVFPWGMDANAFLRADEPFDEAVRAAQWMTGKSRPVTVPTALVGTRDVAVVDAVAHVEMEAEGEEDDEASEPPPTASQPGIDIEVKANEVVLRFGPRTWRIRGHEDCTSLASIRVSIRVATDYGFFSDTVDILSARARASFLKQAREELEIEERILKADFGHVVLRVEELVDAALRERLEPSKPTHTMSDAERTEALALLRDPKLIERIVADFERCGVIGERDNKLIGYLATVSRRLDEPLAVVIQSSSAAGKSSLMDAVLRLTPEEEQVSYSALTGQSLFYMGGMDLKHKVLAIAEEAGASQAAYALRVLQSSGQLTIASTGKDAATGRLSAHEYKVQGPVAILMTTTALDVDDELLNRCIVLTVDESPEQTAAIQELQRRARTLDGLLHRRARLDTERLHQNVQRLLVPLSVVNPFAPELTFTTGSTRSRRDQKKLLTLIDTIAFLHQYQRTVKTAEVNGAEIKYVEATRSDIELAMKLAKVFQHGIEDVPPQTATMLAAIKNMVDAEAKQQGIDPAEVRFTRRQLRERFGWSVTQTRVHLDRLTELEHVVRHRAVSGQRFLYGLAATDATQTWRGVAATWRPGESQVNASNAEGLPQPGGVAAEARQGNGSKSYRSRSSARGR